MPNARMPNDWNVWNSKPGEIYAVVDGPEDDQTITVYRFDGQTWLLQRWDGKDWVADTSVA